MFWQAAVLVATVRKPLFGKQIQMDMEHFLPHPPHTHTHTASPGQEELPDRQERCLVCIQEPLPGSQT